MQIYINGEEEQVSSDMTMAQLIEQLELQDQRLAVEVNEELVPRSTFPQHQLQSGDRVEIVHAIGGG
jgi:sulfur carrier protein